MNRKTRRVWMVLALCFFCMAAQTPQGAWAAGSTPDAFAKAHGFTHAEIEVPVDKFRDYPEVPMALQNTSVNLILQSNGSSAKDITKDLNYPLKNINGRTAMALRDAEKLFHVKINWFDFASLRIVDVKTGHRLLIYAIDRNAAYTYETGFHALHVGATIDPATGRAYVPLRNFAEYLKYEVAFNGETQTVQLTENNRNG